jgi:hypothetical protein|nr:MAG TPA: hypothetical protein [Bacteriophage sp.]
MVCNSDRLVLEINQGCPRGFGFTLKQKVWNNNTNEYNMVPVDLTGLTINVQVKMAPYVTLPALIEKNITEVEDLTQGQITDATNGKFKLQITQEDSVKLNPGEYALVINMVDKDTLTHLSGDGNNYAIYRVCYQ